MLWRPVDPENRRSGSLLDRDRNIRVCVRSRCKAIHRTRDQGSGEKRSDGKDVDDPPIGINRAINRAMVGLTPADTLWWDIPKISLLIGCAEVA